MRPALFGGSKIFTQQGSAAPAPVGDSLYSKVKLLLHGDGANGSTTFTDNSVAPKTPTVGGNASISTAQAVFGQSMYFDGTGDFLQYANSFDWALGSEDFCIELRWRPDDLTRDHQLLAVNNDTAPSGSDIGWGLRHNGLTGNKLQFYAYNGINTIWNITGAASLTAGTWYAIRAQRNGASVTLSINGASDGSAASVYKPVNFESGFKLHVGRYVSGSLQSKGYMDELRITKSAFRSGATYTVDTNPFPDF